MTNNDNEENKDDFLDFSADLSEQQEIDLDFKYATPAVPVAPKSRPVPAKKSRLPYVRIAGKNITVVGIATILIILIVLLITIRGCFSKPAAVVPDTSSSPESQVQTVPKKQAEQTDAAVPKIDKSLWNLKLVNNKNTIGEDFVPKTVPIEEAELIDERVLESYLTMQAEGSKVGLDFYACSGYRPYSLQEKLFNEQVEQVMYTDNCGEKEATKAAATVVAVPGTSEHQTGLAVDIVTANYSALDEGIKDTPEMQWLYKNAQNYGFILRFPADKQDVTGIIYEPWHFRYVGVEAAKEITSKGITLEEYLDGK